MLSINSINVSLLCLGLSIACTIRCLGTSIQRHKRPNKDADGDVTKESKHTAATIVAWAGAAIVIAPSVGLATSMHAMDTEPSRLDSLGTNSILQKWTCPALWALLMAQSIAVYQQKNIRQKCKQAANAATSSAALVAYISHQRVILGHDWPWSQLVAVLALLLAFSSLRRRPVVFFRGNRVLNDKGVSILEWIFFSWGLHPEYNSLPAKLSLGDLPRIGPDQSVRSLRARFDACYHAKSLWFRLAKVVLKPLASQWILVFLEAVFEFASRFVLHHLLQQLEMPLNHYTSWTLTLVVLMPLSLLGETVFENWQTWVGHAKVQLPLISLLQSLLFEKTMRIQAQNEAAVDENRRDNTHTTPSLIDAIIPHSQNVANAFFNCHELPIALFKIGLYSAYLSRLLGFKTVIAGGTVPVFAALLSRKLPSVYSKLRNEQSDASARTSNIIEESLMGLRQIRLSSMESLWRKRLLTAREHELNVAWEATLQQEMIDLVASLGPILFASATLSMYAFQHNAFSPSVVFTSVNLLGNLHAVIRGLPGMVATVHQARLSFAKLQLYLNQTEKLDSSVLSTQLYLESACLAWPGSELEPILKNVTLAFPRGVLSLITGKVGSGKSLLLSSILGEAIVLSGRLGKPTPAVPGDPNAVNSIVPGAMAYVSQPPWIEDRSIRENILFGYHFDKERYQKVLKACGLRHDLGILSDGDRTLAGQAGSALSGGQKWRVALARALYSPAEILLLEDIIAAVDAPVARFICEHALKGELVRGRTVLLATHHPQYCSGSSRYLVALQNGTATGTTVSESAQSVTTAESICEPTPQIPEPIEPVQAEKQDAQPMQSQSNAQNYWEILQIYIRNRRNLRSYIIGIAVVVCQRLVSAANSWWLATWASKRDIEDQQHSTVRDVAVYILLSVGGAVFLTAQALIFTRIGHDSSRLIFSRVVQRILGAKLSWIDTTPPGQVIQTLNSDMYAINHRIAPQIIGIFSSVFQIFFLCTTASALSPYTIASTIVLLLLYWNVARTSLSVASKLRPIYNSCNFPISNHATSSQSGLRTIRAFNRNQLYIDDMQDHIDGCNTVCTHLIIGFGWLGTRLGLLGASFVAIITAAAVLNKSTAASTGLAITFALQLRHTLQITIGRVNVVRTGFNAVDRVMALARIPSESWEDDEPSEPTTREVPPKDWPSRGAIQVRQVSVRYGECLPWALNNISFSVQPGQRLGVVGRTGAGKTSLTNAMLRFIEASEGSILIDDLDISHISTQHVRRGIEIIPQDPFLFSGTLRSNVDLYGKHSDAELVSILQRVCFMPADNEGKGICVSDLDMAILSGGTNISHGQRQLVCLARVMLHKSRIVILDEATSGMDGATEAAVQRAIQNDFADTTIIVVAHKLLTVAGYDSILVLSQGEVAESGTPRELLAKEGVFWDMVEHSEDAETIKGAIGKSKISS